ncbi:MAG: hypothetical protein U9Q91_06380 [Candidatus Marinimicrobia bacterium]|nr:hypothetical protein [Candidatus Neomarinimicrobiota bacterium]
MKKRIMSSYLILVFLAFALVGCFTVPDPLYDPIDPDVENAKTPTIISVDKAAMWTDESLTITGTNFSDSLDENTVYFFTVNEPVIGDTTVVKDSLIIDGTYNVTNYYKDIDITSSDYVTTITSIIAGVTSIVDYRVPTTTTEYTTSDSTTLVLQSIATEPVFTVFDTTFLDSTLYDTTWNGIITSKDSTFIVSIDTTGYTKMLRTVTTYGSISDWVSHTAVPGVVTAASATSLTVTPPEVDVLNAKIAIHVQGALAPAEWGFIDLMVRP